MLTVLKTWLEVLGRIYLLSCEGNEEAGNAGHCSEDLPGIKATQNAIGSQKKVEQFYVYNTFRSLLKIHSRLDSSSLSLGIILWLYSLPHIS